MADKKVVKKTEAKKGETSLEEIKKRKEEVLARIDAEIGEEESSSEVVVDEKTDKKIEVDGDGKKSKEDLEEKMTEESNNDEKIETAKENGDEEVKEDEKVQDREEGVNDDTELSSEKDRENSTFSAAEFGMVGNKSNKGKNIALFFVVFLLVAGISALFFFFFTGALKFQPKEEKSEVIPTETPTPTEEPVAFEREDLSVQVLNGSGVSGAAGEMQTYLEDLKYENIEVGNADSSDYINVSIQLKEEIEEFVEFIIEDVGEGYIVDEDYEILDEDNEYDVLIIVGLEESDSEEEADE